MKRTTPHRLMYTIEIHLRSANGVFDNFRCILHYELSARCSAIAARPRCRVRYSFRQK